MDRNNDTEQPFRPDLVNSLRQGIRDGLHEHKYDATDEELYVALSSEFLANLVLTKHSNSKQSLWHLGIFLINLRTALDFIGSFDDLHDYVKEMSADEMKDGNNPLAFNLFEDDPR